MTHDDLVKKLMDALKSNDPEKVGKVTTQMVIDTMPENIKAAGGVTNPEAVELASQLAHGVANQIAAKLFFLFITKPNHNHEFTSRVPSLADAAEELKLPLYAGEKGEPVKDTPNAPAPTQRPAVA